jgi:hypothetical protein
MSQKAKASDGATVIQVAGNFQQGISLADCERLFNLLLTENFPRLEAVAAAQAKENVNTLVKATFEKIEAKIALVSVDKLAQPDVQSTFNTAVQGAARKGAKIDIDLLAELLEARIEKENSDYVDNCIEAAVEMVPKLTSEMLALLPALHFIQALSYDAPDQLDQIYGKVHDLFLSKCGDITPSKLKTMASIGVGTYINIMGADTFASLNNKYPHLKEEGAEARSPRVIEAHKFYDTKSLHQLTLTTPGQVIAVKMLEKIFPEIDLRACIQ